MRWFTQIRMPKRIAASIICFAGLATLLPFSHAQTLPKKSEDRTVVRELIEQADGLPIDYRADIQLNAVEAGRTGRGKWEMELLERLFHDAAAAKYQYKQKDVIDSALSRSRKLETAFTMNLDALSIRTRVVKALLSTNRQKARDLFEEISLRIPTAPCSSPMVYDVTDYYVSLDAVLGQSFSAAEKAKGDHVAFLLRRIEEISAPAQLAPMAALLAKTKLDRKQLEWLTSTYVGALGRTQASDRELGSLERAGTLHNAVRMLGAKNAEQSLAIAPLLNAYRSFLFRSAQPARCADITTRREKVVQSFNQLRQETRTEDSVEALQVDDLKPARTAESAEVELEPLTPEYLNLMDKVMALRQAGAGATPPPEDLESAGWESDVAEFLRKVDALDPSQAKCHSCVFYEKANLLFIFFDFMPKGSLKERVLDRLVNFLATDTMQEEAPLEWLFCVKLLLNLSRSPSKEQSERIAELRRSVSVATMMPSDSGPEIVDAMRRSKNYILFLFVRADEILKNEYVMPPYAAGR